MIEQSSIRAEFTESPESFISSDSTDPDMPALARNSVSAPAQNGRNIDTPPPTHASAGASETKKNPRKTNAESSPAPKANRIKEEGRSVDLTRHSPSPEPPSDPTDGNETPPSHPQRRSTRDAAPPF